MKAFLCALALVACGAPAPDKLDPALPKPERPRPETPEPSPEPVVDAGADAPEEPPAVPCYYVSYEVELAWPGAPEALQNAAARWYRWYEPGGLECPLRLLATSERAIGSAGLRGDIVLNTEGDTIVDGDSCGGDGVLLIDALTHELGHAYGLGHTDGRDCAMCRHDFCEPVVPTRREIRLANGCGVDGPPVGAECPP